jgi:hypothetical protein
MCNMMRGRPQGRRQPPKPHPHPSTPCSTDVTLQLPAPIAPPCLPNSLTRPLSLLKLTEQIATHLAGGVHPPYGTHQRRLGDVRGEAVAAGHAAEQRQQVPHTSHSEGEALWEVEKGEAAVGGVSQHGKCMASTLHKKNMARDWHGKAVSRWVVGGQGVMEPELCGDVAAAVYRCVMVQGWSATAAWPRLPCMLRYDSPPCGLLLTGGPGAAARCGVPYLAAVCGAAGGPGLLLPSLGDLLRPRGHCLWCCIVLQRPIRRAGTVCIAAAGCCRPATRTLACL